MLGNGELWLEGVGISPLKIYRVDYKSKDNTTLRHQKFIYKNKWDNCFGRKFGCDSNKKYIGFANLKLE